MFLHTFTPGPIALHIGAVVVYWYGLLAMLGGIAGFLLVKHLARRIRFPIMHLINLTFYTVLFGYLGARVFYVVCIEWPYYHIHPGEIVKFWHGGISIQGGIIAGGFVVWLYARHYRKELRANFWQITDLIVPGAVLAQAIGRWGNYFNQELFGRPTDLPWGIPIDAANRPAAYMHAAYFHPTFLYESLWNLVTCFILVYLFLKVYKNFQFLDTRRSLETLGGLFRGKYGLIALSYIILYSLGRFLLEFVRIDAVPLWFGIRATQATALLFILFAVLLGFGILKKHEIHQT